jgi:hypothetical protein
MRNNAVRTVVQVFGCVGLWLATGAGSTAQAQTATNIDVPALLQRLDELEQKVKVLERKRELERIAGEIR